MPLVWATGYRSDYSRIDAPVLNPDHQPLHRSGRSPVAPLATQLRQHALR